MSDDFSVRVSRRGQDARRAKDHQLLFSSGSRAIQPLFDGLIRAGTKTGGAVFSHNLGYRPFFILYRKGAFNGEIPNFTTGAFSAQVNDGADPAAVDNNVLGIPDITFDGVGTVGEDLYYVIFDVNLAEEFESEVEVPMNKRLGHKHEEDFQFKVLKDKPIRSSDPRDYSVNTDFQPIMLHQVKHIRPSDGSNYRVEHGLGYPPMFYIFRQHSGDFFDSYSDEAFGSASIGPSGGFVNSATADDRYINMVIFGPFTKLSIVVLKDPLL